jgi:hypothetical protein
MRAANEEVKILTVGSCSNLRAEHRSHVVVSGSYGGRYNAFNAAKWPVRAVIMNDAGVGKDGSGIGSPISTEKGSSRAPSPPTARPLEIPARSTTTASCRTSTPGFPSRRPGWHEAEGLHIEILIAAAKR